MFEYRVTESCRLGEEKSHSRLNKIVLKLYYIVSQCSGVVRLEISFKL